MVIIVLVALGLAVKVLQEVLQLVRLPPEAVVAVADQEPLVAAHLAQLVAMAE